MLDDSANTVQCAQLDKSTKSGNFEEDFLLRLRSGNRTG